MANRALIVICTQGSSLGRKSNQNIARLQYNILFWDDTVNGTTFQSHFHIGSWCPHQEWVWHHKHKRQTTIYVSLYLIFAQNGMKTEALYPFFILILHIAKVFTIAQCFGWQTLVLGPLKKVFAERSFIEVLRATLSSLARSRTRDLDLPGWLLGHHSSKIHNRGQNQKILHSSHHSIFHYFQSSYYHAVLHGQVILLKLVFFGSIGLEHQYGCARLSKPCQ